MANAAILKNGRVKRTTNLSGLAFNASSGFLVRFVQNGITYIHSNKGDFRKDDQNSPYVSAGYYNEAEFLKYLAKQIAPKDIPTHRLNDADIESAVSGDKIWSRKLKIKGPDYINFGEVVDYAWTFDPNTQQLDNNLNIIIPANVEEALTYIAVDAIAAAFYNKNIALIKSNNFPADKREQGALLITNIALRINMIMRDIFVLFASELGFNDYIISQKAEWSTGTIFTNPTIADLQQYYSDLNEYYKTAYSKQVLIKEASRETKFYWLASVLSVNGLKIIPSSDKIRILEIISKSTIKGETSILYPSEINEEEFIIRIVLSVVQNQVNSFLNGLISSVTFEGDKVITLYQSIYDKVNDYGGNDNLKLLMDGLYRLWLKSQYFPFNTDGTVKESVINAAAYAQKPISLNYTSTDFAFGFGSSNFEFKLEHAKIHAIQDFVERNSVVALNVLIGSYDIYQTVTIQNTNANTNHTTFIAIEMDGEENASLPLFYLKYLNDKIVTDNITTLIELSIDVGLTFTGISNLRHLRHIRTLNKLGRAALGLEAPVVGQTLITYELAQGVAGAIELPGSVASIILNYLVDYKYKYCNNTSISYDLAKCQFYTKLDDIATVMQLVSGPLDLVTSMQLRKAATDILSGPVPNDFDPDALLILQRFAGNIAESKEVFRVKLFQRYGDNNSVIWQRINNTVGNGGLPAAKQEEFILDFERAEGVMLDAFNADNGEFIKYWKDFEFLKYARKDLDILGGLKRFKYDKPHEWNHITDFFNKSAATGGFNPAGAHAYKNITNNIIRDPDLPAPPPHPDGTIRLATEKVGEKNGHKVYENVYFYNPNGTLKKKSLQTIWNSNWNDQRILEEMAFAWGKKKVSITRQNGSIEYTSALSDGTGVTIKVDPTHQFMGTTFPNHLALFSLNL